MNELNDHIIQKIGYDVTVNGGGDGLAFQQALDSWSANKLMPALEALFDRFSEEQTVIEIDQLTLDLDLDLSDDWETTLLNSIVEEMERQLLQKIKYSADPAVVRKSLISNRLEQWLYFLERGYLPWQTTPLSEEHWRQAVLEELVSSGSSWQRFKSVLMQNALARQRLLRQYDDDFLSKLVAISTNISEKEVTGLKPMIFTLLEIVEGKKRSTGQEIKKFRQLFWSVAFRHFVIHARPKLPVSDLLPASFWEEKAGMSLTKEKVIAVLQEWIDRLRQEAPPIEKELIRRVDFEDFTSHIHFSTRQKTAREKTETDKTEGADPLDAEDRSFPEGKTTKTEEPGQKDQKKEEKDALSSGPSDSTGEVTPDGAGKGSIVQEEKKRKKAEKEGKTAIEGGETFPTKVDSAIKERIQGVTEKSASPEKPPDLEFETPAVESLYINYAGIILLHPFLPRFFELLELVVDGNFKDEESRQRAVHLLHFLAGGEQMAPEYRMPLAKLLCGIPLRRPIDRDISLKEEEKREGLELLEAVIEHWKALGSSSPEALRETFLQREGKLEQREDGWHLYVEQKAVDILVERIPWTIGYIQLPWMPQSLWVYWIS